VSVPHTFDVYTAGDEDEMALLLAEVFAERDPPAVAVGLTPLEFEPLVRLFCPKAAEDGLTIVARSGETGALIGALLTEDATSPPPPGVEILSPKFDPIFDILGRLDADYKAERLPEPGEALHLFLLGVDARYAGQGVAQQLVATCLANGARCGYRAAITEATNRTSQHVFRKQGFIERVRGSYAEHLFDGTSWFTSIAEHGGPILMDKTWQLKETHR
jgi:ribosomal protein S18 acetylase RimI-like enzyme